MIPEKFDEKSWKNFRLSLEKYSDSMINEYAKYAQLSMEKWKKGTKSALNVQLPKSGWHKKRPNSRKLFPYRNTGTQVDSVIAGITKKVTGEGNVSITAWAEIDVPYATYTDNGQKHRKNGGEVGWVDWEKDIFSGHGRGRIKSIADIFKQLADRRSIL